MLELRKITKDYGSGIDSVRALKEVSISFDNHGFVTILGPSGCGKTTMLNIIGGLDHYTSGDLVIDDKSTKTFTDREWDSYRNHRIGFVFQSYNLIPHLTVLENVELSLVLNGTPMAERKRKALDALIKVGLEDQTRKRPNQLSGGQMQRVAIARALVNDPDIILADEPTGALDSETSVQVMDILHGISKEKLIVMVTHNIMIAEQYSDRIVKLKDGEVVEDTANIKTKVASDEVLEKEINSKTSMGILTALKLSFRNLKAKKGRTFLSGFAGAIGILGVALVLAMSNGFQNYVDTVEGKAVNSIPVSIGPIGEKEVRLLPSETPPEFPSDGNVNVYNPNSTPLVNIHYNRFTEEYLDYVSKAVDFGHAQSVVINYGNLMMNLIASYGNSSGQQYRVVDELRSNGSNSLTSQIGLINTIYHELYGEEKFIKASYDVIAGEFPKTENEIVLIVDKYNRISLNLYNALGFGSASVEAGSYRQMPFTEFLNRKFKVVYNDAFYEEVFDTDPQYAPYIDTYTVNNPTPLPSTTVKTRRFIAPRKNDNVALKEFFDSTDEKIGIDLRVSGIIRIRDDAVMSLMNPSIGYTSALKNKFLQKSLEATPIVDAVWNNSFVQDYEGLADTITFATNGNINPNPLKYCEKDSSGNPILDDTGKPARPFTSIEQFINVSICSTNPVIERDYDLQTSDINYGQLNPKDATQRIMGINTYTRKGLSLCADLTGQFSVLPQAHPLTLIASLIGASLTSSIAIFPSSLQTKPELFAYLDEWNDTHVESERIYYMDIAGMVTEGIGTMIEIITIVLICFASLALLVSSVMTAIITYVAVIERRKEIGVLRALGARKFDVGLLFETETIMTGLLSGILGVVAAYLISVPLNIGLNSAFPGQNLSRIADLPWYYALALIGISALLTFIAGFIPSQIASKKDPVLSLRAE